MNENLSILPLTPTHEPDCVRCIVIFRKAERWHGFYPRDMTLVVGLSDVALPLKIPGNLDLNAVK